VAIDRSGKWWRGDSAADLDEYLAAYTEDAYPVGQVRHSACKNCHGVVFGLRGDDDVARRTCRNCGAKAFVADSRENWQEATIRTCRCPCGGTDYNVAVGFSLREGGEVRWVAVGNRCVKCGVLGSFADWGVNYAPTSHLFDLV
jgi:hypothetical protein